MLSSILSRLFYVAFILLLIAGSVGLAGQFFQKTFVIGSWHFGGGGIPLQASRLSHPEKEAPDTTIKLVMVQPDSSETESGQMSMGYSRHDVDGLVAKKMSEARRQGNWLRLDTEYYSIAQFSWESDIPDNGYNSESTELLPDGRVSFIQRHSNEKKAFKADTFKDTRSAKLFAVTKTKTNPYILSEQGTLSQSLSIHPSGTGQRVLFLLYDFIYLGAAALLMFFLSRLFRHFSRNDYFTLSNTLLIKNTGICLLVVQLLKLLFYYCFLAAIHPLKLFISGKGDVQRIAQYDIESGVDWTQIFLGLGLLVLSYIFLNGLQLREEQSLTV